VIIIGHRGASGYAPEHTFASWDLALTMSVDYIEQDLQMTSDGVLVVMHDPTLDRTTSGSGEVIRHTLAEVQALDAGSWFDRAHTARALRTIWP
jgi:glycerophosphoryl diester phosphodiesterase